MLFYFVWYIFLVIYIVASLTIQTDAFENIVYCNFFILADKSLAVE